MESEVKEALNTTIFKATGGGGGGCISSGNVYITDTGNVFVKVNDKPNAERMFKGEFAGLEAILKTCTIKCPQPLKVVVSIKSRPRCALVMENVIMKSLGSEGQSTLGEQLALMHLDNQHRLSRETEESTRIGEQSLSLQEGDGKGIKEFGFAIPTSCGYLSQDNNWQTDWTTFFIRQKLQSNVDLILNEKGDRELNDLWPLCMRQTEKKLSKVGDIAPALLHGDLWSGNIAQDSSTGLPVIFDPAAFYGHSEYDLGIASMFGGFSSDFFTSYHKIIPQAPGFSEREPIYELFHHLNHWNHFGVGYRSSTLRLMKQIINSHL